jgi:hypothetical protein
MPIRPENKDRYPADWPEIRTRVLERAKRRCEWCGVRDGAWIQRLHGAEKEYRVVEGPGDGDGFWKAAVRIVLTIAHLDHTPEHCDPGNLRALCQRCHNGHDAKNRAQGVKERREAASPQGRLTL